MKTEAEIRAQLAELVAAREQRERELIAIQNQEAALLFVLGELPEPETEAPAEIPVKEDANGSNGTSSEHAEKVV